MQKDRGIDSVRLGRLDREEILNSLEQGAFPKTDRHLRQHERYTFRQTDVPVRVQMHDGSSTLFRVCSRNISKGGMGFLHGGFLHPGSPCEIVLTMLGGETLKVRGKIVQCHYITGRLHEVGVKFTDRLDMSLFCAGVNESSAESDAENAKPTRPGDR